MALCIGSSGSKAAEYSPFLALLFSNNRITHFTRNANTLVLATLATPKRNKARTRFERDNVMLTRLSEEDQESNSMDRLIRYKE